jgi:hypothetical protein
MFPPDVVCAIGSSNSSKLSVNSQEEYSRPAVSKVTGARLLSICVVVAIDLLWG